ncbi:MAG: hypothetical protein M3R17_08005 [Bacteroidota bacterium]|nr:hypothetical protein [Bacteroidota bacterium]
MTWFLRAKHWQIFLLIFVVPIVVELIGFMTTVLTGEITVLLVMFFIVMLVVLGTQFGWFYTVGTALGERIGPDGGMNLRRFRAFVLVPLIYVCTFFLGMVIFALCTITGWRPSPSLGLLFFLIIPMHFFSMFCIFHSIWFVAKTLKMTERWNHVEFSDYAGDFFLIWFFFVGIWFVQPRINRLFDPTLPPLQPPSDFYNPQHPPQNHQYAPQQPMQPPSNFYNPQYPPNNPPPNYPPPGN